MNNGFINFHRPCIGREEINEVIRCLKSGWLTTASRTKKFEENFAFYTGFKHAVALNSCTAALHLALEAIGLKKGDLVLVPTMTFAATAEVVRYFSAYPVLVDCNENDYCLNMNDAENLLSKLANGGKVKGVPKKHGPVKAIMPVHFGGHIADVTSCRKLCSKYGLYMIEDCAHVCPAFYKDEKGQWQMGGHSADIACYSFYATKTITTGEGGMAVTNNKIWADRMRIMSLHGISKDAWKRFTRSGSWRYDIIAPGFKYNMTDIAASLGIHQLKKAKTFWDERKKIVKKYNKLLSEIPGLILPKQQPDIQNSWHLYILRIDNKIAGIHRNEMIEKLKKNGIGTSVHYIPLHLHSYYKKKFGFCQGDFPIAEKLYDQSFSIPVFPGLTDREVKRICNAIRKELKH